MEDFPLLILFFIIYLVATTSSGKKKKKSRAQTRRSPMRTRVQGEQRDARAQQRDTAAKDGFRTAFSGHEDAACCAQERMHLHEVTNEQMMQAGEGEDPCHAGGNGADDPAQEDIWTGEEALQDSPMQDALRGVIMSEILMRPSERRALQRSRQKTNGY